MSLKLPHTHCSFGDSSLSKFRKESDELSSRAEDETPKPTFWLKYSASEKHSESRGTGGLDPRRKQDTAPGNSSPFQPLLHWDLELLEF